MAYAIFWPLVAWALFSKRPVAVYLFFGAICFGAFSALPPALTGGITLLPKMVCAPLLAYRMAARPGGLAETWSAITQYRKLGLLTLFMIVSILITMFAPRLFVGQIDVIGLNTAAVQLLVPSGTNFSQLVYLFFAYITVVALFLAMRTEEDRQTVMKALVLGGAVAVITGLLDLAAHGSGLLEPFRNASYAMMTDQEIMGSQRIAGLMSEASAYGGLCVFFGSTLYFLRPMLNPQGRAAILYWGVTGTVLLMAALSTASSAFLGLGAFGAILAADWLRRALFVRVSAGRIRVFREFALVGCVLIALLLLFLMRPAMFQPAIDMVDKMVFQKAQSSSYAERSMWNTVSFRAFLDSWGVGVGVGSTRTSSWAIAVVASTGLAGIATMGGFLLQAFTRAGRHLSEGNRQALAGAKLALVVSLVPISVAGTLVDFGALNAVLFAVTAALGASAAESRSFRLRRRPQIQPRRRAAFTRERRVRSA